MVGSGSCVQSHFRVSEVELVPVHVEVEVVTIKKTSPSKEKNCDSLL